MFSSGCINASKHGLFESAPKMSDTITNMHLNCMMFVGVCVCGIDLRDGLGESAAGLVADPHLVFRAESRARGLQLRVHALVR